MITFKSLSKNPGAIHPTVIRLAFDGVDRLDVDDQGDLVLRVGRGEIRQHKPVVYQDIDGVRTEISGRYLIRDHQQVAFHVGDYDASRPLTIDPVLVYSRNLDRAEDLGLDIAVDAAGSAYVTGRPFCCGDGVFVAKMNADGTLACFTILSNGWSNPVGGASSRIALDGLSTDDVVYLTGTTGGNFPTTNAFQPIFGGGSTDAFVAKLNSEGRLFYATYLGGDEDDVGRGIALEPNCSPNCRVFVTGATNSTNFPTAVPDDAQPWQTYDDSGTQGHFGVPVEGDHRIDAFVLKLHPESSPPIRYLRTFGDLGDDRGFDIAVSPFCAEHCDAHVTGVTASPFFPIVEGFDDAGFLDLACGPIDFDPDCVQSRGLPDVFVAKVNHPGDALIYSTVLNLSSGGPGGGGGGPESCDGTFCGGVGGDGTDLFGPAIALQIGENADQNPEFSPNACVTGTSGPFVAKLDPMPPPPPPQLVADAGPDQIVEATSLTAATVTFDGTGSINPNPDGGELAYFWTVCDEPQQGEADLRPCREHGPLVGDFYGPKPTWELPIGTTEVELFVVENSDPDPLNNGDADRVLITVTKREHNGLPVADAGPDQTCILQEGEGEACQVTPDGSGTKDPDGDPVRYNWEYTEQTLILTQVDPVVSLSVAGSPHTITLSVYDDFDLDADPSSDTVDVIVKINHAPVLVPDALLPEMVIPCIGPAENVKFDASAVFSDPDGDALTFTWEVKLGGNVVYSETDVNLDLDVPLHPGIYQVTLTANDLKGGINSADGLVDIQADKPPTLSLSLSPDTINANNHKMVAITAMITVADACDAARDAAPGVELLSITSSDPDNGTGDADTPNDIQDADVGTDDRGFSVRAERSGNVGGRVYTVTYEATDAIGNSTEATATVTVPHDQSGS